MRLIAFAAASLCLCQVVWAAQPAAAPATAGTTATAAVTASADKVYPPLPTLAMLPPSTGDDDDLPAPRANSRNKKKTRQRDCHCTMSMPAPRLVVSDASRTYLKDIERQLDSALAQ